MATVLSVFCGAGGLDLGLHNAGLPTTYAIDSEPVYLSSYKYNFPNTITIEADLSTLPPRTLMSQLGLAPGDIDVLIGGPPCKGFSILGKRDPKDPRNSLVYWFADLASELNVPIFAMENVEGLCTFRKGLVYEEILSYLSEEGFSLATDLLCAADYGDPQVRERIIIIGKRGGKAPYLPPPTHEKPIPEGQTTLFGYVSDREPWVTSGEALLKKDFSPYPNHSLARHRDRTIKALEKLKPGESRYKYKTSWRRLNPDLPSPTVTGARGGCAFVHPTEPRILSPRELATLMSFPLGFSFLGSKEDVCFQIANAVPIRLATAIGVAVRDQLEEMRVPVQATLC